jgi:hypothetical protein
MGFLNKSYKIPRVCLLLFGLGVFALLLGVTQVASADDQTSNTHQPLGQLNCGGCDLVSPSIDGTTQSLTPNLEDACDVCHTAYDTDDKEVNHQQITEYRLHNLLINVVAFQSQNPYFADDSRLALIVDYIKLGQDALRNGDVDAAMALFDDANDLLDGLRIEAQHTNFIDGSTPAQQVFVAAVQTNSKSRTMNEVLLSGQSRLLLDIEHQKFVVISKQQVGFTVRTEQVLHRRVPLSDEEGNVLFYFVSLKQRWPSFEFAISVLFYQQAESQWLNTLMPQFNINRSRFLREVVHQSQPTNSLHVIYCVMKGS